MSWLPRKSVVVPVDFSDAAVPALQTALEFVKSPADVHVIHALVPLPPLSYGEMWGVEDTASRLAAAQENLSRFLKKHNISGVTEVVREGDAGLLIADYARETNADLIVMSSHGYHGVTRLLLGSVAERVLRHADCQVLLLRRQ